MIAIPARTAKPSFCNIVAEKTASIGTETRIAIHGTEFAHLHGLPDGGLHLVLPPELHREVIAAGWGSIPGARCRKGGTKVCGFSTPVRMGPGR
jgi:hypothetical protein